MTLPEHTRQPLGPNQERWIQALESGKFKQGKYHLRTADDEFCCLGVACEIAGIVGVLGGEDWSYIGCDGYAPPEVVGFLALYDCEGEASNGRPEARLSNLNDNGKSFQRIAAIIRSDPSVYFKEPR